MWTLGKSNKVITVHLDGQSNSSFTESLEGKGEARRLWSRSVSSSWFTSKRENRLPEKAVHAGWWDTRDDGWAGEMGAWLRCLLC